MLSKRSVSESQLLLGAVPKSAGTKEGWCTLMEELAWSFKVMYQGACPKKDKRGGAWMLRKGEGSGQVGCGVSQAIWNGSHLNFNFDFLATIIFALTAWQTRSSRIPQGLLMISGHLQLGGLQL